MINPKSWLPSWWDETHGSAWERVKEAMRRDWEQTKQDLGLPHGHELNQGVADTVKQAMGSAPIPGSDRPIPPKVIGTWDDAELPMGYGYTARHKYGAEHPAWNEGIELRLQSEWEAGHKNDAQQQWSAVRPLVRRGYEYEHKA